VNGKGKGRKGRKGRKGIFPPFFLFFLSPRLLCKTKVINGDYPLAIPKSNY